MADRFASIEALVACLTGRFEGRLDWDRLVALANQSLTITSFAAQARKAPDLVLPEEVAAYLEAIHERNRDRNRRLLAQLQDVALCLNRGGIEVAVMKGAAILIAELQEDLGDRLLTDLDLLVRPEAMFPAIEAMKGLGYDVRIGHGAGSWPGNPDFHLPTVLSRPDDAGSIDLQCRPRGPASFGDPDWLFSHSRERLLGEARVMEPSAMLQIVYLLLHDQFQDGDYWRGLIDLRHLLDIHRLSAREPSKERGAILGLFKQGYERHAIETQFLTLDALFGRAERAKPAELSRRARLQLVRRRLQVEGPLLMKPLTALSLLSEIGDYAAWDRFGGEPHRSWREESWRRLREVRRIFRPHQLGKL
jgi:hypothetical protein